jgi:hypothetical protein
MKQRVSVSPVDWNFEEREIEYAEFKHLAVEYARGYSHLQSKLDVRLALLAILIAVTAPLLPLVIVDQFAQASGWAPHAFGFLLVAFGLATSRVVYLAIPNDASKSFPVVKAPPLSAAVELLENAVGVSWAGVRLSIAESGGYYAIRNPRAVGRIESIENSAWIEVGLDKSSTISSIVARINLESGNVEFVAPPADHTASLENVLKDMVNKCVAEYVKAKGSDEILDELMTELGIAHVTSTGTSGGVNGVKDEADD